MQRKSANAPTGRSRNILGAAGRRGGLKSFSSREAIPRSRGHGGPGVVANTYLEGTYSELSPNVSQDEAGMKRLFMQFSFPGGIPSRAAPETPGSIHEGGELGYSLSHGYKEEGTTTTPFDMVVLNELDRFHLVADVVDRVPSLGTRAAYVKQLLRDKLIDHKTYIDKHGEDLPEVRNWRWQLK